MGDEAFTGFGFGEAGANLDGHIGNEYGAGAKRRQCAAKLCFG